MPNTLSSFAATRWIEFKGSGRTRPAVIACDLPDGGEVECVVKLSGHQESSPHQPVCELVAALLALDLKLPVAEPLLVEISPEFVDLAIPVSNTEAKNRCQESLGLTFATRHLPGGYSLLPIGKPPPKAMIPELAKLYAFDGIIQNADRTQRNSNCLVKGSELRFFDHDLAFGFLLDILGPPNVTDVDSYSFLSNHLAKPCLKRDREQFESLQNSFTAIDEATLNEYRNFIPDSWSGKNVYFPAIETHLNSVFSELDSVLDAITSSLPSS